MHNIDHDLSVGLLTEEAADRVDEFCFALADVLRRILGVSLSSAGGMEDMRQRTMEGVNNA